MSVFSSYSWVCKCVYVGGKGGVFLSNDTMLKPDTVTLEADASPLRIYLIC